MKLRSRSTCLGGKKIERVICLKDQVSQYVRTLLPQAQSLPEDPEIKRLIKINERYATVTIEGKTSIKMREVVEIIYDRQVYPFPVNEKFGSKSGGLVKFMEFITLLIGTDAIELFSQKTESIEDLKAQIDVFCTTALNDFFKALHKISHNTLFIPYIQDQSESLSVYQMVGHLIHLGIVRKRQYDDIRPKKLKFPTSDTSYLDPRFQFVPTKTLEKALCIYQKLVQESPNQLAEIQHYTQLFLNQPVQKVQVQRSVPPAPNVQLVASPNNYFKKSEKNQMRHPAFVAELFSNLSPTGNVLPLISRELFSSQVKSSKQVRHYLERLQRGSVDLSNSDSGEYFNLVELPLTLHPRHVELRATYPDRMFQLETEDAKNAYQLEIDKKMKSLSGMIIKVDVEKILRQNLKTETLHDVEEFYFLLEFWVLTVLEKTMLVFCAILNIYNTDTQETHSSEPSRQKLSLFISEPEYLIPSIVAFSLARYQLAEVISEHRQVREWFVAGMLLQEEYVQDSLKIPSNLSIEELLQRKRIIALSQLILPFLTQCEQQPPLQKLLPSSDSSFLL